MKYFFPQIDDFRIDDSSTSAEDYFRSAKLTGLIEKRLNSNRTAVMIFVNGVPCMAYMLEDDHSKIISLAEFLLLKENVDQVRAINVPDVAGRLALLALESQSKQNYSIAGTDAWKRQIDQWSQEQWSGLVEITSKESHGFALFWQGEPQKSDVIFSTSQGFITDFPEMNSVTSPAWDVFTYSPPASAQAYQCTILRHGAMHWGHKILSRYQEMVGIKLLQMMDRELNRQIQPWHWNIALDENDMVDRHFFAHLTDAAHAYRALFMAMGAQMNIVIGNNLTQRLLNETFGQIHPDERAVLQSQRLIPAAFTE